MLLVTGSLLWFTRNISGRGRQVEKTLMKDALIIGIVVGTYSSIYVASAALLALGVSKFDLLQVEKEGAEAPDAMP